MNNAKARYVFLVAGLALCVASIALIMVKGKPQDRVSLDSVAEVGEGVLHSVDKVGRILTSVSDEEEMKIGDKIHEKVARSRFTRAFENTPLEVYVNEVGAKVTENVKRKAIRYKFHIVESFYPNAFAAPGGHIYVTMGLLAELKTEAELASVLAHEVAHVDAKHSIGLVQYKIKAEKVLGPTVDTFADVGYGLFLRPGYSEVQESESDAGGVYLTYEAGYHPLAIVYAFERIDRNAVAKGYENTSATPVGDTVKAAAGMVTRYFSTHPSALDRIDKVNKYIADNKLITETSRFYIGQKNYDEKVSYKRKRYPEEFSKDYVVKEEKKAPAAPAIPAPVPEQEKAANRQRHRRRPRCF